MKKLIVLGIVAAMVMGMGVAASAVVWQASCKNSVGSGSTGNLTFGNASNTTGSWNAPAGEYVAMALPTVQTWAPGADFGTWQIKNMATTNAANKSWTIAVWATAGFSQPATIKLWASNYTGLDVSKEWGFFNQAGVKVASAVINTTKTTEANNLISFTFQAPVTADPKNGAALLTFKEAIVPEPGSMLAMLSGMVGLVGYGIRRRK